ncbi:hypothetical protein VNO78_12713 [Psophocarpus tetragonolobus]|uniref:Uncharacterized protein n=1 Tax=Psophocarpus tetragonolobus TaxID=3891 RepID=A0AAN9SNE8_PSOTE
MMNERNNLHDKFAYSNYLSTNELALINYLSTNELALGLHSITVPLKNPSYMDTLKRKQLSVVKKKKRNDIQKAGDEEDDDHIFEIFHKQVLSLQNS